jgi:hypothetical protein
MMFSDWHCRLRQQICRVGMCLPIIHELRTGSTTEDGSDRCEHPVGSRVRRRNAIQGLMLAMVGNRTANACPIDDASLC